MARVYWPINVESPKNISKWQMWFNSAFKGLKSELDRGEWLNWSSSRFSTGKRGQYQLNRDFSGFQIRSGRILEKRISFAKTELRTPVLPSHGYLQCRQEK
jgi:hypothetical protein